MPRKNEREAVISYLTALLGQTKDGDLKYDISRCVTLLRGEDPEDVKELKEALEEAICENEVLCAERTELIIENDYFKGKL